MNKKKIKICGVKDLGTLKCCIENKVNFFGLIFYKKSPRNIKINKAIELIKYSMNKKIFSVGVFVNKEINALNKILKILKLDYVQLHGDENNDYINKIKKINKIKIIKAVSIRNYQDFKKIDNYNNVDFFLFDYKPKKNELPGGNSKKFNWKLINKIKINKNWFLSGGINIGNINEIKKYAIPYGIDVSSGVEDKPGFKSNEKIKNLINKYNAR